MPSTWFTTLASIRKAQPDWAEIACYRAPIARFLRRTYPRVPDDLRDDIVQDVLCAMHGSAVARFRPERGRFRDYLRGVIRNQVRKAIRERRAQPLGLPADESLVPAVDDRAAEVIDLQASLVRAVREFHDDVLRGDGERQVLYCLSGRLIDGLSYKQIAAKEAISTDAVKRRLQAARKGILKALVRGSIADRGEPALDPRALAKLADQFGEALASRRPAALLSGSPGREAVVELAERVRHGVRWFPGLDSPDGQAFTTALQGLLDP